MPQICVRFRDNEYNDLEKRANESNTTKPRIIQFIVEKALLQARGSEGMPAWQEPADRNVQIQTWKDRMEMFKQQLHEKESESVARISMLEEQLHSKDEELGFLRMEYAKLSDLVVQKQLPAKTSWWSRHFGRNR